MTTFKSDLIQILHDRGFIHQHTNLEGLDKKLASEKVTAYLGVDPTADSMHVGHLIPAMMLYWLQQTGHKPITLVGGATALVGDPSFKDESRPLFTEETVAENSKGIQQSFQNILEFGDGETDAMMVNNADWLKKIGYIEFLRDYGPHFSINRMLSFESVKRRLDREQNLSFLEFNYMLMQAYDFVELYKQYNCTLQLCGADQWGNVINGIELGRRTEQVELFGLTTALLTTSSGKKMGKSEGNAVWLNEDKFSNYDYYQFWRNTEDGDVVKFLKLFTALPMNEIDRLSQLEGAEINDAKKILAFEATKMIRGEDAAKQAEQTAAETFAGGGKSDGLPSIDVPRAELDGMPYFELFVRAGLADSNGEVRRLIKGGGAKVNDVAITDNFQAANADDIDADGTIKLSAGKKRHVLINVV